MPRVISRKVEYDYESLKPKFFEIMDAIGGSLITANNRVLIKPNLLAPASPDKAVVTHPLVVKAAVEYVLAKGAKPLVADSPAMGSFERVLKESGLKSALEGLDVELKPFRDSMSVDVGEPFHHIEISEDAMKADAIINLPKLKTHSQMLLTLGVKNLFGCIVGLRKPEWHLRAGVDRELFALMLTKICRAIKPTFTVLDGILAMEGPGPGKGGIPRHIGVLMGSDNPVAVDIAACRMLGIDPDRMLTNQAAANLGMVNGPVEVEGDTVQVPDFQFPEIITLFFGPQFTHGLMRKHLVQRPVPVSTLCKTCGECWQYCPVKAISHDSGKLTFDYDKCIRCYCCLEVCPHGALRAEVPFFGKIFNWIVERGWIFG